MAKDEKWSDPDSRTVNEQGSKTRSGGDTLVAQRAYSDWRRTVGNGCYASDVDFVEWRKGSNDDLKAVGVIELTFPVEPIRNIQAYCDAVLERFERDSQYRTTLIVSGALGVNAYLVVASADLRMFSVCRLGDKEWRYDWTQERYKKWLISLRPNGGNDGKD